jgi:hypothetical protein
MSKLISRDTCIHYMPCCRKASATSEQVRGEGSWLLIAQSPNVLGSHLHRQPRMRTLRRSISDTRCTERVPAWDGL